MLNWTCVRRAMLEVREVWRVLLTKDSSGRLKCQLREAQPATSVGRRDTGLTNVQAAADRNRTRSPVRFHYSLNSYDTWSKLIQMVLIFRLRNVIALVFQSFLDTLHIFVLPTGYIQHKKVLYKAGRYIWSCITLRDLVNHSCLGLSIPGLIVAKVMESATLLNCPIVDLMHCVRNPLCIVLSNGLLSLLLCRITWNFTLFTY